MKKVYIMILAIFCVIYGTLSHANSQTISGGYNESQVQNSQHSIGGTKLQYRYGWNNPIGKMSRETLHSYAPKLQLVGLRKSVTGFRTADNAARAALKKYNPMSIRKNREYGGVIFRAKDGSYGYTRGLLGTGRKAPPMKKSLGRSISRNAVVGQYHTHGAYSDKYYHRANKVRDYWESDEFSKRDKTIHMGLSNQYPNYNSSYLGTPSSVFKVMRRGSIFEKNL
ncbi:virulence protein [Xenorhabdus vietnamensis]|uniref:Virulence protein n=1 Tax=Xenorhabdus vietnamensis TaxID=351656 RepID=A0A1Y2SCQ1_9GAMM|nr:DUF4329 domain-containing protein [Xenorhabdus vietnamensis]OTA16446.1 virulence protein [Xenorhabdus vietnamensis]